MVEFQHADKKVFDYALDGSSGVAPGLPFIAAMLLAKKPAWRDSCFTAYKHGAMARAIAIIDGLEVPSQLGGALDRLIQLATDAVRADTEDPNAHLDSYHLVGAW